MSTLTFSHEPEHPSVVSSLGHMIPSNHLQAILTVHRSWRLIQIPRGGPTASVFMVHCHLNFVSTGIRFLVFFFVFVFNVCSQNGHITVGEPQAVNTCRIQLMKLSISDSLKSQIQLQKLQKLKPLLALTTPPLPLSLTPLTGPPSPPLPIQSSTWHSWNFF